MLTGIDVSDVDFIWLSLQGNSEAILEWDVYGEIMRCVGEMVMGEIVILLKDKIVILKKFIKWVE